MYFFASIRKRNLIKMELRTVYIWMWMYATIIESTSLNNCEKFVIAMDDNEIIHKRRTTWAIIIIAPIEYKANQTLLKLLYDISDHCLSTT